MTRLKDQLHWELKETPAGRRINIEADNKAALDAVPESLRFQIEDHSHGRSASELILSRGQK
jgi:hypothetical protein